MYLHKLKRVRVAVSVLFFILIVLLFFDFRNTFAPVAGSTLLYLQFVPSLQKFMHSTTLGAIGFLLVLFLTMAAGRVYCSTICPLGTLQDMIGFAVRKRRKHALFSYRKPGNALRYSVLLLTALLLLAGSNILLNFLDPFSGFGRMMTNIMRPIALGVNNVGAMALEQYDIYFLARGHWAAMAPFSTGVAVAMLLLVLWLAATRGRLYCNSVCPVGALLGFVARFSFLRIKIVQESCIGCKRCETVCKAGCIDLAAKTVDMSRCVSCYNCLAVCANGAMQYSRRRAWGKGAAQNALKPDRERRLLLLHSGVYLLGIAGLAEAGTTAKTVRTIIQSKPTVIPVIRTSPVSLPGSASVAHFTATCTACHLCVSACPTQVLLPSVLEYGLSGVMLPRMNYRTGHCNYECTVCTNVCPTGALLPLEVTEKKITQIGVATFIRENCVVYTDNTACGACSEHCPTKAVKMVPYENPLNRVLVIPEVTADYCIGCGGCEHACPTKPYKAIFVDGNPVHKTAKKPLVNKVELQVESDADFPF